MGKTPPPLPTPSPSATKTPSASVPPPPPPKPKPPIDLHSPSSTAFLGALQIKLTPPPPPPPKPQSTPVSTPSTTGTPPPPPPNKEPVVPPISTTPPSPPPEVVPVVSDLEKARLQEYASKLALAQAEIDKLKEPGLKFYTEFAVTELQGLLKPAEVFKKASKFMEAYEVLQDVKTKAQAAYARYQVAPKEAAKLWKAEEKLTEKSFTAFKKLSSEADLVVFNSRRIEITRGYDSDLPGPGIQNAVDQLTALRTKVEQVTADNTENHTAYQAKARAVGTELTSLLTQAPPEVYAPLKEKADAAALHFKDKKYAPALHAINQVGSEITQALTALRKEVERWNTLEGERKTITKDLVALEKTGTYGKYVAEQARLKMADAVGRATREKQYKLAADSIEGVKVALAEAQKSSEHATVRADLLKPYSDKVNAEFELVVAALAELAKKMQKSKPPSEGRTLGTFSQKRNALMVAWREVQKTAGTLDLDDQPAIEAYLDKESTTTIAAFKALKLEIDGIDPEVLKTLVADENKAKANVKAAADFRAAQLIIEKKLKSLVDLGTKDKLAKKFEQRYQAICDHAEDDYRAAQTKLSELDLQITPAITEGKTDALSVFDPLNAIYQKLVNDNKVVAKNKKIPQEFKSMLVARLTLVGDVLAAGNVDAIKSAKPELDALALLMANAQLEGGRLAAAQNELDLLEEMASKNKNLDAEVKTTLQKEIGETREALSHQLSSEYTKTLDELKTKITTAIGDADFVKTEQDRLAKEFKKLATELDGLNALVSEQTAGKSKKYTGTLRQDFEAAKVKAASRERAQVEDITRLITEIRAGIKKYQEVAPFAIIADQQKTDADAEQAKQSAAEWAKTFKLFKSWNLKLAQDAVAANPNGDKKALKQLEKFAEDTDAAAKSSKDYDSAYRQLQVAKKQVELLVDTPQGMAGTSRKEFATLAKKWSGTIASFKSSVTAFVTNVTQLCDQDDQVPKDAIGKLKALEKAGDNFDVNAFARTVAIMSDEARSQAERKEAREEGLRVVRQYMGLINADPLIQHLVMNPFQGGLVSPVYATLRDLEFNLLRCV